MAGHSQFKNIMYRKGAQDAKRAKLFTKLTRELTVAARAGSPDPAMNPRLRAAIQASRAANMPKDRVERAITRGGGGDGESYAGEFLADSTVTSESEVSEGPGTIIKNYKLLQRIGEGGFGVVYMAEQTEPVRRQVALKIIKPGMDTREVRYRCQAGESNTERHGTTGTAGRSSSVSSHKRPIRSKMTYSFSN